VFAGWLLLVAYHFPWNTDTALRVHEQSRLRAYYATAYSTRELEKSDQIYVEFADRMARAFRIEETVREIVKRYGLEDKRVLDVGSGRGYLQNVVGDYTGLDISPTASRFYTKRFVVGTATAMPFADGEFDALWSIWVLEHVPNPEAALQEMRRVVKPGGILILNPAWFVPSWASQGYEVRSYSELGITGKLIKATLPLRGSAMFEMAHVVPARAARIAAASVPGPTRFRYRRLQPNYREYWQADSDAVNSMDPLEAKLWFESRGDRCDNCPTGWRSLLTRGDETPLIIRRANR
jgi:SAM-dependent methyltransferase